MSIARTIAAAAAVLAVAAAASPAFARDTAPRTTGPDPYVVVSVGLTDTQLRLSTTTSHKVHIVAFRIVNRGKKTHIFKVGVVKSPIVKPGATFHLVAYFPDFGRYKYSCTLNCGAAMSGVFSVNR